MSGTRFTLMAYSAGDGWPSMETVRARGPKAVVRATKNILAAPGPKGAEVRHEHQQAPGNRDAA